MARDTPNTGQAEMNAALFFGLAGVAALNPKLLVVDLIVAGNSGHVGCSRVSCWARWAWR